MRGMGVASSFAAWEALGVAGAAVSGACASATDEDAGANKNVPASAAAPNQNFAFMMALLAAISMRTADPGLAFSPAQFASQNFVVGQSRRADERHLGRRLRDNHAIFRLKLKSHLTVERQKYRLAQFDKIQFHFRRVRNYQRPVGQHVRTNRRDHKPIER